MITFLLTALIVLAIIGLILWGINQIPGIPQIVKVIVYVIIGVVLLLWLLHFVQGGHSLSLGWRHGVKRVLDALGGSVIRLRPSTAAG